MIYEASLCVCNVQESILQRCFVAEKLTAIAATPSGAYVAAGGASGNLYVWNSSTGRLLLGFKAHYKV
jgi:pre-rRNA-processing protein IPI3